MAKDIVILVVDDERNHADGMAEALEKYCDKAIAVYTATDAMEILRSQAVDVVVTDLNLGDDYDGLDVLDEAKKNNTNCEVIIVTAYETIETCKDAIRRGAYDYLVKPIDIDQLRTLVEQAGKKIIACRLEPVSAELVSSDGFFFNGVRGEASAVKGIFEVLKRVAPSDISVLIEGPSGSGKELLARAIHDNSKRRRKLFRPINCAGMTESLLESELFGHAKGAFTGAAGDRKGLFEIADQGTIFLDEIGDMPLNFQAKLLRVLEDGVVLPVGSETPRVVDVRIISATNHDVVKLIEEKKFRQDLYFRIKGVSVVIPALKDRRGDIPKFVEYFISEAVEETGSKVAGITSAAMEVLMGYDWPGNIRQLRNCIRSMVVLCDGDKLDVRDVPAEVHQLRQLPGETGNVADFGGMSLGELEKQAIIDTLTRTGNNREQAAKILGIGERTLYRKIKEYDF